MSLAASSLHGNDQPCLVAEFFVTWLCCQGLSGSLVGNDRKHGHCRWVGVAFSYQNHADSWLLWPLRE